jgi:CubicO group peptidase (beta-lactamase class C family)
MMRRRFFWPREAGAPLVTIAVIALCAMFLPAGAAQTNAPTYLESLERRIREIPNLHSVLVVQVGRTTFERYLEGRDERRGVPLGIVRFERDTLHDVRSVTKSIVSILLGIAIADGAIASIDDPVLNYFPEYADLRTAERLRIRLRHVASMTSGLHWDERTFPYTDVRNSETAMDRAQDRYRHILSQPIDTLPGERFNYSGGDVAIVAAIISRATNMPIEHYAATKLFAPLGITRFEWLKDRSGTAIAASGLRLRPIDMAAIGGLMLRRGRVADQVIVPESWVEMSTAQQAPAQGDARCGVRTAYLWWLITVCRDGRETPLIFANGNGGQYIWVVPSLDLVIVSTAGAYNIPRGDAAVSEIARTLIADLQNESASRP